VGPVLDGYEVTVVF